MKERTRRIDTDTSRESDGVVVPEKQTNRGIPVSTEAVEGRTPAKRNAGEEATTRIQSRQPVSFGLEGVRTRAKTDKTCWFTALLHHITPELLRQSFYELNRKAMPGIDGAQCLNIDVASTEETDYEIFTSPEGEHPAKSIAA
jgi:hypothetical protein